MNADEIRGNPFVLSVAKRSRNMNDRHLIARSPFDSGRSRDAQGERIRARCKSYRRLLPAFYAFGASACLRGCAEENASSAMHASWIRRIVL